MNNKLVIVIAEIVAITCPFISDRVVGEVPTRLGQRVEYTQKRPFNLERLFVEVTRSARTPGGIVKVPNAPEEVQQLDVHEATLAGVLNALVHAAPSYYWTFEKGVVNLLPSSGEPALLRVRINRLSIQGVMTTELAITNLLASSEVKNRSTELKLNTGLKITASGASNRGKSHFDLDLKNVTVREALNAIVLQQGHGVWQYRETHWRQYNGFEVNLIAP